MTLACRACKRLKERTDNMAPVEFPLSNRARHRPAWHAKSRLRASFSPICCSIPSLSARSNCFPSNSVCATNNNTLSFSSSSSGLVSETSPLLLQSLKRSLSFTRRLDVLVGQHKQSLIARRRQRLLDRLRDRLLDRLVPLLALARKSVGWFKLFQSRALIV